MRKQSVLAFIVLTVVSLLLNGCAAGPLALTNTARSSIANAAAAPMDWMVQVPYGETVQVDRDHLSITFDQILEDSRCPLDVMCAWSGWARVALTLAQPKADPSVDSMPVEITVFTDSEGVVELSTNIKDVNPVVEYPPYRITLRKVEPYPASTKSRAADSEYVLTIQVERLAPNTKPQQLPPPTEAPRPTAAPTATDFVPPFGNCPDGMVLPLACVSNQALVKFMAGASDQKPVQLSAPVAVCDVPDQATADAICAQAFDDQWQVGDGDLLQQDSLWYPFTPTDQAFWYWDSNGNAIMPHGVPPQQAPTVAPTATATPAATPRTGSGKTPTDDVVSVTPNRPFTLKVGQTGVIGDDEYTITFEGVTHDERCPLNAACEVRGGVSLVLAIQTGASSLAPEFTIETDAGGGILDDTGPTISLGYTLYILAVRPYPQDSNQPINPNDYVVKLLLSE